MINEYVEYFFWPVWVGACALWIYNLTLWLRSGSRIPR